jgi:phenylpropionate dioxygenase-like ring-hydroxylating dioxygenase large terminal subunit
MDTPTKKPWLLNPSTQPYSRNQWYVAALSTEVNRKPLRRKILDTEVVLFRTRDGAPVALYDRCPHRSLPFSHGELVADEIQCAYHGMRFNSAGVCTAIPGQTAIPKSLMKATSYPLVEKSVWIWIWMGNPEQADEKLIPDHRYLYLEHPDFQPVPLFSLQIDCNYQLCHENLIDLTHLTFLHKGAFETGGVKIADAASKLEVDGTKVRITHAYKNLMVDAAYAAISGFASGTRIDRTLITETIPPCLSFISNVYESPDSAGSAPKIWSSPFAMTPRDRGSTNYFFVSAANYDLAYTEEAKEQMRITFEQDKVALEAIQRAFDSCSPDFEYEFSVRADSGAMRVRRIIHEMAASEAGKG